MSNLLKYLFGNLEKLQELVVIFFMGTMVSVAFLQIVGRYTPFPFSSYFEEILRYSFVWVSMLGGAIALKNKSHIGLNVLSGLLPENMKKYIRLWGDVVSFLVSASLTVISFRLILKLYRLSMVSTSLEIPMWIISLSIPAGFMFMSFYCLIDMFKDFKSC